MEDAPQTFETRLSRMEDIARRVQSGSVPLADVVRLAKEGDELYRACEEELKEAEAALAHLHAE